MCEKSSNEMIYYDVELQFPNVYHEYANIWNFAREFAEAILNGETIYKINPELWKDFSYLDDMFSAEIVYFNDLFLSKELAKAIIDEQEKTHITIAGQEYERIRYGDPIEHADFELDAQPYYFYACHDCKVIKGKYSSCWLRCGKMSEVWMLIAFR